MRNRIMHTHHSFFEPGKDSAKRLRSGRRMPFGFIPVRFMIPNLITILAFCMGLIAIRMGIEARYELAVLCIIAAAILDSVDGNIARMLRSTSRFGAELDSLSDLVSFGVAPVVLLYVWSLKNLGSIGWIGGMSFALATALRLARFNTALYSSLPSWHTNFFVGMPAPAGAFVVMLPLYMSHLNLVRMENLSLLVLFYVLFVSFMMVSRVPTFSTKIVGNHVSRELFVPLALSMLIIVTFFLSYPWAVLTLAVFLYWLCIPVGVTVFRNQKMRCDDTEDSGDAPLHFSIDKDKHEYSERNESEDDNTRIH